MLCIAFSGCFVFITLCMPRSEMFTMLPSNMLAVLIVSLGMGLMSLDILHQSNTTSLPHSFIHTADKTRATSGFLENVLWPQGPRKLDPLNRVFPLAMDIATLGFRRDPCCNVYSCMSPSRVPGIISVFKRTTTRLLILLMLFISGNVHINPGPDPLFEALPTLSTPHDFSCRHGLGFLHFNARSLVPKLPTFRCWFEIAKPDVVAVSETWLKPGSTDNVVRVPGYNIYRTDRKGRCGGVALYISDRFQGSVLHSVTIPRQFEFLAVQIVVANSPLTIICCYRPPSATSEAMGNIVDLISKCASSETVLLGDLNWDWLTDKSASFKQQCDSLNLTQIIHSPTRLNPARPDGDTLIDIILTNAAHKYVSVGVFANDLSDHCAIACVRNTKLPKTNGLTVIRRCFKHFSEQAFLHDLAAVDWFRMSLIPSMDEAFRFFHEQFLYLMNKHAPLKKIRIKNRANPWFSRDLADLIHVRNRQWSLARKSKSGNDWLLFRVLRNKCTVLTRKLRSEHYLSLTTDTSSNHCNFWRVVKTLQQKGAAGPPPKIRVGDSFMSDKKAMSNAFNSHFKRAGHIFDELTANAPQQDAQENAGLPVVSDFNFDFSPILVSDVVHALSTLDPKKSAGPDGIDPFFLKLSSAVIAQPVTDLFNISLSTQSLPEAWKQANVSPLLKAGDPCDVNNYRPISNLSALAKILEGQVSKQVKVFLDSNSILNPMQSGFRAKHSTVTACLNVIDDIRAALGNKSFCAALFIDLSKAFDTVDPHVLLRVLSNAGFCHNVLGWFKNYLVGRTQCVKFGDTVSDSITLEKGVPQGSILGPLLFLLYVNHICSQSKHCKFHMYADDTILYSCAPSLDMAVSNLASDFVSLQHELRDSKLLLNGQKTKAMLFAPNSIVTSPPNITTLDGVTIEWVALYKYLGIWLDNKLNFTHHIDALAKKLKFTLSFFYRMKSCFSSSSRKKLVTGLFMSQLDYGDVVYRFACSSTLGRLDPLFHAALRFITSSTYRTHHCTLYSLVGWSSLASRRLLHWYIFIYKAILGNVPPYICSKFELVQNSLNLRSNAWMRYVVPNTKSEAGKKTLAFFGPWSWNDLQTRLKLASLIPLVTFKRIAMGTLSSHCSCFDE